jgi:transcription-repair coupling factor (superfamily II helicase)
VQKGRHFRLAGNDKLRIDREIAEPRERAQFVRDILRGLAGPLR